MTFQQNGLASCLAGACLIDATPSELKTLNFAFYFYGDKHTGTEL